MGWGRGSGINSRSILTTWSAEFFSCPSSSFYQLKCSLALPRATSSITIVRYMVSFPRRLFMCCRVTHLDIPSSSGCSAELFHGRQTSQTGAWEVIQPEIYQEKYYELFIYVGKPGISGIHCPAFYSLFNLRDQLMKSSSPCLFSGGGGFPTLVHLARSRNNMQGERVKVILISSPWFV